MKTILLILRISMILLMAGVLNAQPVLQWQRNLGSSGNDTAWSIKLTSDGGYIVAAQSSINGDITGSHGGVDYWVAKLDAAGNITWQKSYGGSGDDIAKCIQQTIDGGYIITGFSNSIDGDVTDHGRSYWVTGKWPNDVEIAYDGPPYVYESWIVKLDSGGLITSAFCVHDGVERSEPGYYYNENFSNIITLNSDGGYLIDGIFIQGALRHMGPGIIFLVFMARPLS